jgi:hypothetical protein
MNEGNAMHRHVNGRAPGLATITALVSQPA